jgi:glutamine synthetase
LTVLVSLQNIFTITHNEHVLNVDIVYTGSLVYDFKGKNLLRGETDGSSYANGGLRATHTAAGYLSIDTSSPIFIRGDTMFIPAAFISYNGAALDEKTPLLRASDALSTQGVRLLGLLGYHVQKIQANIGLEQEYFFVPREAFLERVDLQMSRRTVLGKFPVRTLNFNHSILPVESNYTMAYKLTNKFNHR